jgi:hypothetical protein
MEFSHNVQSSLYHRYRIGPDRLQWLRIMDYAQVWQKGIGVVVDAILEEALPEASEDGGYLVTRCFDNER